MSEPLSPAELRALQSEADFQEQVLLLAKMRGWLRAHFRPARTTKGWRTAVAGDGKGFPDLVLVRERIIYAELKREGAGMTPDQHRWHVALMRAGAEVHVWFPSDWEEIGRLLA